MNFKRAGWKKAILAVVLLLSVSLLAVGCGEKKVATVNGEAISKSEFDQRKGTVQRYYETNYGINFSDESGADLLKNIQEIVLDQLVTEHILMQEARKNKIEATKEEVQARIDQDKLAVGGEQAYLEILKNQIKMSEKEYQAEVEKQIIVEKLYQQIVAGQTVTDEEIQKYYQENQSQYLVPMQIRARHILVATEEEAKTILNELKAGADFAQLALDKSIDPSAKQNQGDLGFFAEDASFVPEFKDAAFKLKVGEISAPIKTEYGYHIIKVEEQKESHQQSFEEVKASIAEELRASRESEKFEQYVEELRQQAKIDKEELPVPTPVNQPADSSPVNQEPAAPQDEAAQSTPNTSE